MAAKSNASATQIDKSSFFWTGNCGICHPGGGPSEFDRWGQRYFEPRTGQWGFEVAGKTVTEVGLDGDYAFAVGSGVSRPAGHPTPPAAWDKTWVSEPDCLMCHAKNRDFDGQLDGNWFWRAAAMKGMAALVDGQGATVHAFAAAPAAGQGWFSRLETAPLVAGQPPVGTVLDLDYHAGVAQGELEIDGDGHAVLHGAAITRSPRDAACWGCHAMADLKKRGRTWFDAGKDVHYRYYSRRHDADASNDVPIAEVQACTVCHPAGYHHEIAKGDTLEGTVAAERNYRDLLSCRDCHAAGNSHGAPVPVATDGFHRQAHLDRLACQACHIAYLEDAAQLVVDMAVTGAPASYNTDRFLSADPGDPANTDRSRWYPSLHVKADSDAVERLFPAKPLNVLWWGAWYHGVDGLPNTADDYVRPVPLWRIRKSTGGQPLAGTTDDNTDGTIEVNRADEIRAYVERFRTEPTATPPGLGLLGANDPDDYVLIKGAKLWWLDGTAVRTYALHAQDPGNPNPATEWRGARVETSVPFSVDHNVRPKAQALRDCAACHVSPAAALRGRKVLVDPYGPEAQAAPIYETLEASLAREGHPLDR